MTRKLNLILFLLCCFSIKAQRDSIANLRLFSSPSAETVIVDNKKITSGNSVVLKPGEHRIRLWTSHHLPLDTVITLKAGDITPFLFNFETTVEYDRYKLRSKKHFNKKTLHFFLPLATTTALLISATSTYYQANDTYALAEERWDEYLRQNVNLTDTYRNFEETRDQFKRQRNSFYIQTGALLLSSYFLYKGIQWTKKNKKPRLYKDTDPFLNFESAYLNNNGLNITHSNSWQLALTFSIN